MHERLLILHTSAHDAPCAPGLHILLSEITGTFLSFILTFERNQDKHIALLKLGSLRENQS